jgi:hypothetical protein
VAPLFSPVPRRMSHADLLQLWQCSRYAARRATEMPEQCSRARVRFAAQNPRALAPSAPFRLSRNCDGRLRREHDDDDHAGNHLLKEGELRLPS